MASCRIEFVIDITERAGDGERTEKSWEVSELTSDVMKR